MRLGARGWSPAVCAVLMSGSAFGMSLSAALKNYYAEYEIVLQCQQEAQLSAKDADAAKAAIAKIETYYLGRDSSIDKQHLLKQAVADKNEGFKIMARSGGTSGLRPYCRTSLHDLLVKAKEIGPAQ
jgi:hypothetical protein